MRDEKHQEWAHDDAFEFDDEIETPEKDKNRYWLHILLFLLTFITTSMAGAEFITNRSWVPWTEDVSRQLSWREIEKGFTYSFAFLAFLTFHEFGHYFTAVYNRVRCSLPYYIPMFIPFQLMNIGSFGAIIRIRRAPDSNIKYFDIGIAGPLAGFVVSISLLFYGFTHLPPLEYLYEMNPEYHARFGGVPSEAQLEAAGASLKLGTSLIFMAFERFVADPLRLPNHYELIHYPFLFVGYITLFFTALNLLPIGQLDGGHVIYGLLGRERARIVSRFAVGALLTIGGVGVIDYQFYPYWYVAYGFYLIFLTYVIGFLTREVFQVILIILVILAAQQLIQFLLPERGAEAMWLFYAFLAVRFIRVDHPSARNELQLSTGRKVLGWLAIVIFALCFTPSVIVVR